MTVGRLALVQMMDVHLDSTIMMADHLDIMMADLQVQQEVLGVLEIDQTRDRAGQEQITMERTKRLRQIMVDHQEPLITKQEDHQVSMMADLQDFQTMTIGNQDMALVEVVDLLELERLKADLEKEGMENAILGPLMEDQQIGILKDQMVKEELQVIQIAQEGQTERVRHLMMTL